jgi:hypothetical protein
MKLRLLIAAAAFATSLQLITPPPQVIRNTRRIAATNLAPAPLELLQLPHHNAKMSLFAAGDGGRAVRNLKMGELAAITKPLPSLPTPGVYKTAPFTCIVVVPGKHADDRSTVKPTEVDSAMPVVKPELRFIPLHSK